jgi:hypothetical protein
MAQIPTLGCIIAFSAPRQDRTAAGQMWQTWTRLTNFNVKGIHGESYAQNLGMLQDSEKCSGAHD